MKELFKHLKPCMYKYNDKISGLETNKFTMGIMAQDIRMGIEASGYNPDNFTVVNMGREGYYQVDYVQLIPVLISKINELEEQVNQLKKEKNV